MEIPVGLEPFTTFCRSRILLLVTVLVSVVTASSQQSTVQSEASNTGVVRGHVRWNEQPIAGVTVRVCSDVSESRCQSAVTDSEGDYIISDLPPGKYEFYTRVPGDEPSTRWLSGAVAVESGKTYTQKTVDVTKSDLELISPLPQYPNLKLSTSTPTLTWKAYPGADNYTVMVSLRADRTLKTVVSNEHAETPNYTINVPLVPGGYIWSVFAYHGRTRIAGSHVGRFDIGSPQADVGLKQRSAAHVQTAAPAERPESFEGSLAKMMLAANENFRPIVGKRVGFDDKITGLSDNQ